MKPAAMRHHSNSFTVALLIALVCGAGVLLTSCGRAPESATAQAQPQLYTCGMHPQVIQDHPGNCPICGMKLTPVRKQGPAALGGTNAPSAPSGSAEISIDPVTVQNMGLRTGLVTRGPVQRVLRTVGVIDFDETALAEVSTKFRGWIEKLYVDSTGQQMHKGEPLFEVYSPELYLAQTEYLLTLDSPTNTSLLADLRKDAAMTKLRYWDISEDQIAELKRTRTPKKTLRINAPLDGVVVEKNVVEGQMVEPGMKLYRLADLATVWIQAQVYEQDLPFIRLGQEALVSLMSQPGARFRGRVTYLYPTVDDKTRTARVRLEFHNPGYFLKPGMYAAVEMTAELSPDALLVPDTAVLRSGERNTVFVALDGGRFEPRTITLGERADGERYEVRSGLKEAERVVTSAQFMLDSESQLREAIAKMQEPGGSAGVTRRGAPAAAGEPRATVPHGTNAPADTNVVYICPMPEHVSLEYDHPGKCPLCGMTLVPVGREMLARIQPDGVVEYYTCPMAEHSDVHQSRPGKCPKCGMTLIPVMVRPQPASMPGIIRSALPMPPTLYTCPMAEHAEVVSDKPGVCPKCGMQLVETTKVNHGRIAEDNWRRQHAGRAGKP